jgi:hypothetical protein
MPELTSKYYRLVKIHPELEDEQAGYRFMSNDEMFESIGKIIYDDEFRTYNAYKKYIDWHRHEPFCKNAVEQLKSLMNQYANLNNPSIARWVADHDDFFHEEIFSIYSELDLIDATEEHFYIPATKEYLEKKEFRNVICFHRVMWILHFGEYHLPVADRKPPAKPGEYYYVLPDPNEPSDIEKINSLLSGLTIN